jgi:hypothetical protein
MTIRSGSGICALSAGYLFESGFLVVADRDVHAYRRTESRAAVDGQRAAGAACASARLVSIGSATSFEVRGVRQEVACFTSFYLYSLT